MRKLARIAIVAVLMVGVALALTPFFIGIYVERLNEQLVRFYNSSVVKAHIEQYHRGWMHSDAVIVIESRSPVWLDFLKSLGVPEEAAPTVYVIDQHIQHGPIFYRKNQAATYFGLAAIQNRLRVSQPLQKIYQRFGIGPHFIQVDEDYISFAGNYLKHFVLGPYKMVFPGEHPVTLNMARLEGNVWISPFYRVLGTAALDAFEIVDHEDQVRIPKILLTFDQHQTAQRLWVGSSEMQLPELSWDEIGNQTLTASGIHLSGDLDEKANELSGFREFHIESVEFDNQKMGPFKFRFSVDRLNAQAIAELISAYRDILQRGELYQSQLQQKMYVMLPKVINAGSRLQLNELSMQTPSGNFFLSGELSWPSDNEGTADDLMGLLQDATVQLQLRVSKQLTDQFILFASGLSLLNQYQVNYGASYKEAHQLAYWASKQNAFFIGDLIKEKTLTSVEGRYLLDLQKEHVPLEDYNAAIQKLFLDKRISLLTSYQLSLQYRNAIMPLQEFERLSKYSQTIIAKQMHEQLDRWVEQRYIIEGPNQYELFLVRKRGKLEINQKPLQE